LEGLMRVQDKIRRMKEFHKKGQTGEELIPQRTGRPQLPPELAEPAKAVEFLKANKERAVPVK